MMLFVTDDYRNQQYQLFRPHDSEANKDLMKSAAKTLNYVTMQVYMAAIQEDVFFLLDPARQNDNAKQIEIYGIVLKHARQVDVGGRLLIPYLNAGE